MRSTLIDRIVDGTANYSDICSLQGFSESERLEFKDGQGFPLQGSNKEEQKKRLASEVSQQLSSFGNCGGGLLIFGWKTKNVGSLDIADEISPVKDIDRFCKYCDTIVGVATDPPIHGVRINAIPDPEDTSIGFVCISIPDSPHKPFKAIRAEKPDFYIRNQGHTLPCGTNLLRLLFYPHRQSSFRVDCKVNYTSQDQTPSNPDFSNFRIVSKLINVGFASSKGICIGVNTKNTGACYTSLSGDSLFRYDGPYAGPVFGAFGSQRIDDTLFRLTVDLHPSQQIKIPTIIIARPPNHEDLHPGIVKISIFSQDSSVHQVEIPLPKFPANRKGEDIVIMPQEMSLISHQV